MFLVIPHNKLIRTKWGKLSYTIRIIHRLLFFSFLTIQLLAKDKQDSLDRAALINNVATYKLKKLIKKSSSNKFSHEDLLKSVLLSFNEKEAIMLPLIQFFISRHKKKLSTQECDIIMQAAIQRANVKHTVVEYLLKNRIYAPKVLEGKASYPLFEILKILASRLVGSLTMQPKWKSHYIIGLFFRTELAVISFIVTRIPWFKSNIYWNGLQKFFTRFSMVIGIFNTVIFLYNLLMIIYIMRKTYCPGYLFFVLDQEQYNENSHRILELLLQYGASSTRKAYFFSPKKEREGYPALLQLYSIEVIAPIHKAVEKNNQRATELMLKKNKRAIHTRAYIITDETPPKVNPFEEKVSVQAIYNKVGRDKKEQACIKVLLPKDFCLEGTSMEELLLQYQTKRKAKSR